MKKAKRVIAEKVVKRTTAKTKKFRVHADDGVYWCGIHIHHISLGVAAVGTLVLVLLVQQQLY